MRPRPEPSIIVRKGTSDPTSSRGSPGRSTASRRPLIHPPVLQLAQLRTRGHRVRRAREGLQREELGPQLGDLSGGEARGEETVEAARGGGRGCFLLLLLSLFFLFFLGSFLSEGGVSLLLLLLLLLDEDGGRLRRLRRQICWGEDDVADGAVHVETRLRRVADWSFALALVLLVMSIVIITPRSPDRRSRQLQGLGQRDRILEPPTGVDEAQAVRGQFGREARADQLLEARDGGGGRGGDLKEDVGDGGREADREEELGLRGGEGVGIVVIVHGEGGWIFLFIKSDLAPQQVKQRTKSGVYVLYGVLGPPTGQRYRAASRLVHVMSTATRALYSYVRE